MNNNRCYFIASVILMISLVPSYSHAWIRSTCGAGGAPMQGWTNGSLEFRVLTETFPAGQDFEDDFSVAMTAWGLVRDADVSVFPLPTGTDTVIDLVGNGNEVGFADFTTFDGGTQLGALAVEYTRVTGTSSNCRIIESNIVFDNNFNWVEGSFDDDRFNANYNFQMVSLHEIGHSLGLNHMNWFLSAMNSIYPSSGPVGNNNDPTPLVDDIRAMRVIYPGSTPGWENLVASRYKNFYGEKADFNRVKLVATNNETNTLDRNTAYYIDYTVENHGVQGYSNIRVGFYLSSGSYINRNDFLIGSIFVDLPYGETISSTAWVQIPDDAPLGLHYLGVVVDDLHVMTSQDHLASNNGVVVPSNTSSGRFNVVD